MTQPLTFHVFQTAQDARDYRYHNGTGGWIFVDDLNGNAVLFPPAMPPSHIFTHPMTCGRSGALLASA